ncbi:oligosaccharide flippase family protein [Paraburkholderia sp. EG287B]|uniref:oligosaccharide flippase family protein n=1 Tax=Paraburkholderia sp. EG287B TaxID=3237010 RepID=UPI0034D17479
MVNPRDSLISLLGVVSGQAALFACIFLIGRWDGPGALGEFNYQLALATFGGTLLALRYELACVSDSPRESFGALVNVMGLALASATLLAGVVAVAGRAEYYALVGYAFAAFTQIAAGAFLNSMRWYGWITVSRVVTNCGFLAYLLLGQVCTACAKVGLFDAYMVSTASVAIVMAAVIAVIGSRSGYAFKLSPRFFADNRRFAAYILPSTICASVLTYALAIVIPHWYGAHVAGYFALAYRLGFFPVSLVGQSIGGVFRRDAIGAIAREDARSALPNVYRIYARSLVGIAALYAIGGLVLFDPVVTWLFGSKWYGAVRFFNSLVPLFALQLIYVPLSQIFLATRAQRTDFMFQLLSGISLLTALCIARWFDLSAEESVFTFSLAGAALMAGGIGITYRVLNANLVRLSPAV